MCYSTVANQTLRAVVGPLLCHNTSSSPACTCRLRWPQACSTQAIKLTRDQPQESPRIRSKLPVSRTRHPAAGTYETKWTPIWNYPSRQSRSSTTPSQRCRILHCLLGSIDSTTPHHGRRRSRPGKRVQVLVPLHCHFYEDQSATSDIRF